MTTNEEYRDRFARQLEAKVAAVNQANAEANRLQPLFIEAFRPFVGKKILTHGGLAQKPKEIVEKLAPQVADGYKTPQVYQSPSDYTLRFVVKTCVNTTPKADHGGCAYHEADFYVGDLDGYNLALVTGAPSKLRTDHSAAEVRRLRKNLDDAEKAQREAQSKLSPFGRYDQ